MYYMPQQGYAQQQGYLPQQGYAQQQGYMPQQGYAQQQGYLPQQGYAQQAYTQYPAYAPQAAYTPQYAYASQYAYTPQFDAPAQPVAPAQPAAASPYAWDFDDFDLESAQQAEFQPEGFGEVLPRAETKERKLNPQAKKALSVAQNILFWAVCIVLVAGSVLFAVSKDPKKNYLGYRIYSVKTESMTPKADGSSPPGGFRRGDLIMVKMCGPAEVKVNDIITFNPSVKDEDNQLFLTHRVIEIKTELAGRPGTYFVTKGDYNNSEDPPISAEMLIGKKVASIPKVGTYLQKVRENFTLAIITIVCFFACIFMFRWYFSAPKKSYSSAVPEAAV